MQGGFLSVIFNVSLVYIFLIFDNHIETHNINRRGKNHLFASLEVLLCLRVKNMS